MAFNTEHADIPTVQSSTVTQCTVGGLQEGGQTGAAQTGGNAAVAFLNANEQVKVVEAARSGTFTPPKMDTKVAE